MVKGYLQTKSKFISKWFYVLPYNYESKVSHTLGVSFMSLLKTMFVTADPLVCIKTQLPTEFSEAKANAIIIVMTKRNYRFFFKNR